MFLCYEKIDIHTTLQTYDALMPHITNYLFVGGLLAGAILLGTVQGNYKKDHFYEL